VTANLGDFHLVLYGALGSLVAGLGTGVGAIFILLRSEWSGRSQVKMLAFAAGVMLAASIFSLLLPALDLVGQRSESVVAIAAEVAAGLGLGALAVWAGNRWIPHEHFIKGPEGHATFNLGRNWLFIMAIALHNLPEGMSVGIAFGGGPERGIPVMLGIGIQNLPEGLAVAAALVSDGFDRKRAFWMATVTGLREPVGGAVGALAIALGHVLLPWGLSFAGGAMLYVIFAEVLPETHRAGRERAATRSLVIGFVVMMALGLTLG